jgi:hypothetical protein
MTIVKYRQGGAAGQTEVRQGYARKMKYTAPIRQKPAQRKSSLMG